VALTAGAPFGSIEIDAAGCTLWPVLRVGLPTGGFSVTIRNDRRCVLRDSGAMWTVPGECPRRSSRSKPQLIFAPRWPLAHSQDESRSAASAAANHSAVKSTIERINRKLADKHWMFQGGPNALRPLKMVRGLPRDRHYGAAVGSPCAAASAGSHDRRLPSRARVNAAKGESERGPRYGKTNAGHTKIVISECNNASALPARQEFAAADQEFHRYR